jgi:2-polyprenyl-3-methyl-5-hydroxy-6-metoxy-1,4-benzoquinol methylase
MNLRIMASRFLLRLGSFIKTLPVVIMKPDDLIEFSRQTYNKPNKIASWGDSYLIKTGLAEDELDLLSHIPHKKGDLLLLGIGGGREAIPLAQMGFNITGIDFVPGMVEQAIHNAAQHGVNINGLVQEISALNVPPQSYDVVWLSRSMYSCIPTRKRRVEMVKRVHKSLKPGGYFICQFHRDQSAQSSKKVVLLHRLIAFLTFGNFAYEPGDLLWLNIEFAHTFSSNSKLQLELEEGGFDVLHIQTEIDPIRGGAVCRKI